MHCGAENVAILNKVVKVEFKRTYSYEVRSKYKVVTEAVRRWEIFCDREILNWIPGGE